jgi:precorrin-6B C5,15-methyltransferase / cobalt-precorrin-6B C5,C15-methyltransferase
MAKWLSIIGIGEDGWDGLSSTAQTLIAQAQVIIGGERHLAMLPAKISAEILIWTSPIETSVKQILERHGHLTCVLASGDPMWYGIGVTLIRQIPISEIMIVPGLSAFSLACARLGWALTEVETISLCGRDPALLQALLYPGARLLVLSAGRQTPSQVSQLLSKRGFGQSLITVLERMGGPQEDLISGTATTDLAVNADLNTIAITCIAEPNAQYYSRLAGLPDAAYQHDGQLTKQEVRAVTLAALAPFPNALLWDVGAGCGSIGIEWLRSHSRCRAIAIEQHPARLQYIADNANALGVPNLKLVAGAAPAVLEGLPQPDAIFIGGGVTVEQMLETCWQALRPGGRLVANAVTVESEQQVFEWHRQLGGSLTRIAVQRAEPVGRFLGWKAMAPITQWAVEKP